MISILMPCYNSLPWLEETLESLYSQTFNDWELIAVDDGSRDHTLSLLRRHAAADSRVKVFTQRNSGVSAARNAALEKASGDFIFFLDSDDLLPPSTLENLHVALSVSAGDIAQGETILFCKSKKIMKYLHPVIKTEYKVMTGIEAAEQSLYQRKVLACLWGKLYKKELFDGVKFPEGEIYEDLSVFYKLALHAERYISIRAVTYLYRQREDSQIHTFNSGRLKVLDVTRRIQESVAQYPDLLAAAHDRRLSAAFNMLGLLLNDTSLPPAQRKVAILQCRAIIRAFRRQSAVNPKVRMKNRVGAAMALMLPDKLLDKLLKIAYK